jgi:hypothetical protein
MEIVWKLLPGLLFGLTVGLACMAALWFYSRRNHATHASRRR